MKFFKKVVDPITFFKPLPISDVREWADRHRRVPYIAHCESDLRRQINVELSNPATSQFSITRAGLQLAETTLEDLERMAREDGWLLDVRYWQDQLCTVNITAHVNVGAN